MNFVPSLKYSINLQKIENATEDFNSIASSNLVSTQELIHWHNKFKSLADDLNLNDPFVRLKYNAFKHIDSLYSKVSDLVHNFNKNHLAQFVNRIMCSHRLGYPPTNVYRGTPFA